MSRTVEDALAHARSQNEYRMPDAPDLVEDFLNLADEVKRLQLVVEDLESQVESYVEQENGEST